jgi:hypothetical protein
VQKSGYDDWSDRVVVTAGNRTYVYSRLISSATTTVTTIPTTTVKPSTTKTSTIKVPTPWPTASPTPESSINVLGIIGAVCLALVVLRKQ